MLAGMTPSPEILRDPDMLYVAIGILGATVMPHNLYLHSSIVQTRRIRADDGGQARGDLVRHARFDRGAARRDVHQHGAILVLAAAAFHAGHQDVADIQSAYKLLSPLLGVGFASTLFACALLASGQNSTLTGTLAGQIVMEGFLHIRLKPWLSRLLTRSIAIVPAVIVIGFYGEDKTNDLLVASQVALSLQLGFAVVAVDALHQRPREDGRIREPALDKNSRLDGDGGNHRSQREAALRYGSAGWPLSSSTTSE